MVYLFHPCYLSNCEALLDLSPHGSYDLSSHPQVSARGTQEWISASHFPPHLTKASFSYSLV